MISSCACDTMLFGHHLLGCSGGLLIVSPVASRNASADNVNDLVLLLSSDPDSRSLRNPKLFKMSTVDGSVRVVPLQIPESLQLPEPLNPLNSWPNQLRTSRCKSRVVCRNKLPLINHSHRH